MATSYNDQWVLQRSAERNTIVRRMSWHRSGAGILDQRSDGVLRVPAGPVKRAGVSSIRAPLKADRRDF
jgi:hypothetical protein